MLIFAYHVLDNELQQMFNKRTVGKKRRFVELLESKFKIGVHRLHKRTQHFDARVVNRLVFTLEHRDDERAEALANAK